VKGFLLAISILVLASTALADNLLLGKYGPTAVVVTEDDIEAPLAPTTPGEIADVELWLQADSSVCWANTARTTPVTDGSSLDAWDDQSGFDRHFSHFTVGQPIWRENTGPNGTPFFDSPANGFLRLTTNSSATFNAERTQATTHFLVGRTSHTPASGLTNFFNKRDGNGTGWNPLRVFKGQFTFDIRNQPSPVQLLRVGTTDDTLISQNVWFWGITTYDGSVGGAGVALYVNSTTARPTTILNDNLTQSILNGATTRISRRRDGLNNDAAYDIADMARWDRVLTTEEIETLATYVAARYGL
jgi:hypothetical protein